MVEKPINSKWQLTLKLDRPNGKSYVKQISSRSTKTFIYVTFVAALWTTSAYVFFYVNDQPEAQTMKAMQYLNELTQTEALESNQPSETKQAEPEAATVSPEVKVATLEAVKVTTLEAVKVTEEKDAGFVLEDTDIKVAATTATVQMSLRNTNSKAEIEGKVAGILILKDTATGNEHRVSSRPGFSPLVPEKADVEARGLFFRAKHRVQKQLEFNLPENTVFDEVKAELTVVTKSGDVKKIDVQSKKDVAQKLLKIGDSGAPAPSIHQ